MAEQLMSLEEFGSDLFLAIRAVVSYAQLRGQGQLCASGERDVQQILSRLSDQELGDLSRRYPWVLQIGSHTVAA